MKSADDRDPIATEQRAAGDGLVELRLNLLRTTRIPLPLTEAFDDVLSGQRYVFVITPGGYELEITRSDGDVERDALGPPGG